MHVRLAIIVAAIVASATPVASIADERSDPASRTRTDQPDALAGACDCTHLVYFVPADGVDRTLDTNGTIAGSTRSLRDWFATQMGMAPRIDLLGTSGGFDITFVRGERNGADYATMTILVNELAGLGLDDPSKRYLVYAELDRGDTCGEATYGVSVVPGATYALVYLTSSACSGSDFGKGTAATAGVTETIAAHEWLHADGAVAPVALHHCPVSPWHVCTAGLHLVAEITGIQDPEQPDVLYPYADAKLSAKVLDRDRDDYLDHGLPALPDLRDSIWLEPATPSA